MKKQLLAGFLSFFMALSLLPAAAFAAADTTGVANVYTLADIKAATKDGSVTTIRLMNDIDVSKEDYQFDSRSVDAPVYCTTALRSDVVFEGNGHTIYNLKSGIWAYNEGRVRNLNISIHDTESDSRHLSDYGAASYVGNINYFGIAETNNGTIENCKVTMKIDLEDQYCLYIGGITHVNKGTIRDCIVNLPVDVTTEGYLSGVEIGGIARYSHENSLIDHCLVLGQLNASGDQAKIALTGLANLKKDTARCVDSAFAMDKVEVSGQREYYFSPGFQTWNASVSGAESCRVANDISYKHIITNSDAGNSSPAINESGTLYAGEGCTLASRSSILADWDLSGIPGEAPSTDLTPPKADPETPKTDPGTPETDPESSKTDPETTETDPFPAGTAEFSYTASDGETKEHYFYYNNYMFYSFDETYRYQPLMATASLCLAMSAFTYEDRAWNNTLAAQDTRRASNVLQLYETLGFTNAKCVHYDKALTDTSDKVAFSMAMKHIDDGEGGTDTVIAVPLRGGGYGGEWGSNFNMTYNGYDGNHVGFQRAATDVKTELAAYISELKKSGAIQGDVKLWITGYSRSAATANILAHDICKASSLGGVALERKNVYAYTFATPAGAALDSVDSSYDPNIFNIISPVDIVPRVAPGAWKYGRYGNTLTLPTTNSQKLIDTYKDLSGAEGKNGDLAIMPAQRVLLDSATDWLFDYVPDADAYYNRGLNSALSDGLGSLLGKAPSSNQDAAALTEVIKGTLDIFGTLKTPIKHALLSQLGKEASNFGRAHHPELYLARLETGNLNTVDDFAKAAMSKQIVIPIQVSGGDTIPGITVGAASGHMGVLVYNSDNNLLASYEDGACKSVSATAELTDMGLVFTLPDGAEDCALTVGGLGEGEFSFSVFSYDSDHPDGPARTVDFTGFDLERGTVYAFFIPGGTDGDYTGCNEDQSVIYKPDYDSEIHGERPLDYADEISFTDVSPDAYYYKAVLWAVKQRITSGTSKTAFSPNTACTRAQAVTFLWRAAGSPEPESTRSPFSDVRAGSYYYDAVLWAVENGITSGTTAATFSPGAACTRAQIVTFLGRSAGSAGSESIRNPFTDVKAGSYYYSTVLWAVENGITSGTTAATFSPGAACTRAQIVTFLYRAAASD